MLPDLRRRVAAEPRSPGRCSFNMTVPEGPQPRTSRPASRKPLERSGGRRGQQNDTLAVLFGRQRLLAPGRCQTRGGSLHPGRAIARSRQAHKGRRRRWSAAFLRRTQPRTRRSRPCGGRSRSSARCWRLRRPRHPTLWLCGRSSYALAAKYLHGEMYGTPAGLTEDVARPAPAASVRGARAGEVSTLARFEPDTLAAMGP